MTKVSEIIVLQPTRRKRRLIVRADATVTKQEKK